MDKHRHDWPAAKKLCRLNQNDIEMAKRLGFGPGALVRARPDPKQKWKLPVKHWIHELHFKRFGSVLGEKPPGKAPPTVTLQEPEPLWFYGQPYYADTEPDSRENAGDDDVPF